MHVYCVKLCLCVIVCTQFGRVLSLDVLMGEHAFTLKGQGESHSAEHLLSLLIWQ
jgi:hypothetical protein